MIRPRHPADSATKSIKHGANNDLRYNWLICRKLISSPYLYVVLYIGYGHPEQDSGWDSLSITSCLSWRIQPCRGLYPQDLLTIVTMNCGLTGKSSRNCLYSMLPLHSGATILNSTQPILDHLISIPFSTFHHIHNLSK